MTSGPTPAAADGPPGAPCWRLRVHGRVQGVGFRHAVTQAARAQGLAGWVRNRVDGTVEILLQGPPAALQAFRAWLPHGVPGARVDHVEQATLAAPAEPLAGFEQRPTA